MAVSKLILLNGKKIGTLVMLYDLGEAGERMRLYGAMVFGVFLVSSLLALLLSSRLRSLITTPISQLAQVTKSVSATRDYGIRATKQSSDELGVLVDAFNQMLASIQSRDCELRKALIAREEALREAQKARDSLQTTLSSIGDAVISTDREGRIVFANRVAQTLLKETETEIKNKRLDDVFRLVSEHTRTPLESPLKTIMRDGVTISSAHDTVLVAKDGAETPVEHSGAPILDDSGAIQGAVIVFHNATARRHAEETSRLLAAIVESSDDAIIGKDLEGKITSWNRGAERIFGYSADEMIGRPISVIAEPRGPDEMKAVLAQIAKGERIDQYQALRRTKDGRFIHVSVTVSPLRDALGRVIGASTIARDITAQVRAADQLAQLNAELQRSNVNLARVNEDLERFAYVASHDLQEPLRMITVYSQLLVRTYSNVLSEKAGSYVGHIIGGTTRMRDLLADLLAYTEIGARSERPAEPVDLNRALAKAIENLRMAIDDTRAVIIVDRLPRIRANEAHFVSLFQNLLGNAIKYRSKQPPHIQVAVDEIGGDFRIKVIDNGIGIAPEYHQKIFGAFKRLHGHEIPGTGIGLAICQRVVERYGGSLSVESQVDKGATFLFTLPFDAAADQVDQARDQKDGSIRRQYGS